jgi:hypothetical protein
MLMSRCQKAGQGQRIKMANRSFEAKCHYADKIKENEVDGACGTHGRGQETSVFGGKV